MKVLAPAKRDAVERATAQIGGDVGVVDALERAIVPPLMAMLPAPLGVMVGVAVVN